MNRTKLHGLIYNRGKLDNSALVDSDYAGYVLDHKSMTVFLIKLGNAVWLWWSKKEPAVSLSTCEPEYCDMTKAAKEGIWVGRIIEESAVNYFIR